MDNTLATFATLATATAFLGIIFTMEVANGMELIIIGKQLKTCVYRKATNKGLLLHVEARHK